MASLVYHVINLDITYTNVLLIDSEVPDFQSVYDSVNDETLPIVYSNSSSKVELLTLLNTNFRNISRIGFFFASSGMTKMFLDLQPFFSDSEEMKYSENVEFIINIIKQFGVKNIDFLACNTLNLPNWISYYNLLTKETNVVVGASNDRTGNIKYGGDWVMETTCENIEFIYFTKTIEYYQYLLDNGDISIIIDVNNNIYGTGYNSDGQLGLGDNNQRNSLTKITLPSGKIAVAISYGLKYTVVLFDDGSIYGTGYNGFGQLGLGTIGGIINTLQPMIGLPTGIKAVAISCGYVHTVVLFADGSIYGTGANGNGQLGLGTIGGTINTLQPMIGLPSGTKAVAISCGAYHTLVLFADGSIYGTGWNNNGQLGLGPTNTGNKNTLQQMILPSEKIAVAISCSYVHTLVLFDDGSIYGTGYNYNGQLGLGPTNTGNQYTLQPMIGLPTGIKAVAISCGSQHTAVLFNDGSIYGTGLNAFGQLGLGDYINHYSLTELTLPTGIKAVAISCGSKHTAVLFADDTIYATGANYNGQLGLGPTNTENKNTLQPMLTTSSDGSLIPMTYVKKLWGSNFDPITPISNVCFPANTLITTNQGNIAIQNLDPKIHTIRNKKIELITKTISQDKYLVCFEKDALSKNVPSEKTIITKNHLIYYKGSTMKAKDFINNYENVNKIKYNGEVLYNVLLKEPYEMMVNNLICETLHPENKIVELYKILSKMPEIEQEKIIKEYNDYCIKNKTFSKKR